MKLTISVYHPKTPCIGILKPYADDASYDGFTVEDYGAADKFFSTANGKKIQTRGSFEKFIVNLAKNNDNYRMAVNKGETHDKIGLALGAAIIKELNPYLPDQPLLASAIGGTLFDELSCDWCPPQQERFSSFFSKS